MNSVFTSLLHLYETTSIENYDEQLALCRDTAFLCLINLIDHFVSNDYTDVVDVWLQGVNAMPTIPELLRGASSFSAVADDVMKALVFQIGPYDDFSFQGRELELHKEFLPCPNQ